jgi:hypothetical protein
MSFRRQRSIPPWSAMWRGCSGVGSQLAGWVVGVVSPYPTKGTDRYLCASFGQLISVIRSAISGLFIRRTGLSQDNKALVMRLFNEVFTTRNLSAANDIVAEEYLEHAVEPFGREEPGHRSSEGSGSTSHRAQ